MCMTHEHELRLKQYPSEQMLYPSIDAHIHLVSFLQQTDGLKSMLTSMDAANIRKSVAFGMPVKKTWIALESNKPEYYLDDNSPCIIWSATDEMVAAEYMRLNADQQKRIAPCINGFDPRDKLAIDYIEMIWEKYPFWRGVGELLLRHDDLTNLTGGGISFASHPALTPIYQFCAKKKVPILLHHNSTSVGISDDYRYLKELTEAVKANPDTTFVWAHCGVSRRITHPEYHLMIADVLKKYPNLNVDISWVGYENIICDLDESTNILTPKPAWMDEVLLPYSNRVMIGSDVVGTFALQAQSMCRYNKLLSMLPVADAENIAYKNAERLWFNS